MILTGPALALDACARRLRALGATGDATTGRDAGRRELEMRLGPADDDDLRGAISWHGPARLPGAPGSEAAVQAMSGLMEVHGRDAGTPRRLGLEAASVAAGMLAAQGVLAALVARSRGRAVCALETSVLEGALVFTCHYVAAATCPRPDDWSPPASGPDPGPPFSSSDGHWFEIETLDPGAWKEFWTRLGAADAALGQAWTAFRGRYFRGSCSLPTGLQQATARHGLAEISAAAAECGVSFAPLRSNADVLGEPGLVEDRARHAAVSAAEGRPVAAGTAAGELPLAGIEVVEATSRMQGPLAGLLLQMLGAHVVRVEPPGGDPIRLVPPYAGDDGYFFTCFNRGKDSVELDLRAPSGRAALLELAAGADVFLHNWRPGKAAEWGADAEGLMARNPRLTYVSASGWGEAGPNRGLLGTDFLVQAHAGMGYSLTPEGEPPATSRVLLTDCLGALVTCEAALAGLLLRERSGRGSRADASLLAGGMALQAHVLDAMRSGREDSRREGRPLWGLLDRPLPTADGYLVVDAPGEAGLERLRELMGVGGSSRAAETAIADRLRSGPSEGWEDKMRAAGIPCAEVCTDLASLPRDPSFEPLFERLSGTCRAPAVPWRFPNSDVVRGGSPLGVVGRVTAP